MLIDCHSDPDRRANDPFYQEGATSISLRTVIFRELVVNIIAHREYTSAAPATMMIYRGRVEFKNPNVSPLSRAY